MKRKIDPKTQCEIIERRSPSSLLPMMLYYSSIAEFCGLIDMPKAPKRPQHPPWHYTNLSKLERRSLSYEDQQELRRYRYTLKKIRDREIWPGMIL